MRKRKGFTEEAKRWMEQRSQAFARATQRKGMPMSYGHGKPPGDKKK